MPDQMAADVTPSFVVYARTIGLLGVLAVVGAIVGLRETPVAMYSIITLVIVAVLVVGVYIVRTRLERRGDELVFSGWLGRREVIRLPDINRAAIVQFASGDTAPVVSRKLLPGMLFRRR